MPLHLSQYCTLRYSTIPYVSTAHRIPLQRSQYCTSWYSSIPYVSTAHRIRIGPYLLEYGAPLLVTLHTLSQYLASHVTYRIAPYRTPYCKIPISVPDLVYHRIAPYPISVPHTCASSTTLPSSAFLSFCSCDRISLSCETSDTVPEKKKERSFQYPAIPDIFSVLLDTTRRARRPIHISLQAATTQEKLQIWVSKHGTDKQFEKSTARNFCPGTSSADVPLSGI
eukprot:3941278-Rhodomonas_salina.4